jgi:hypothetical protein
MVTFTKAAQYTIRDNRGTVITGHMVAEKSDGSRVTRSRQGTSRHWSDWEPTAETVEEALVRPYSNKCWESEIDDLNSES